MKAFGHDGRESCRIATRMCEAFYQTEPDRVGDVDKYERRFWRSSANSECRLW